MRYVDDKDVRKILRALNIVMDSKGWVYTQRQLEFIERAVSDIESNQIEDTEKKI